MKVLFGVEWIHDRVVAKIHVLFRRLCGGEVSFLFSVSIVSMWISLVSDLVVFGFTYESKVIVAKKVKDVQVSPSHGTTLWDSNIFVSIEVDMFQLRPRFRRGIAKVSSTNRSTGKLTRS